MRVATVGYRGQVRPALIHNGHAYSPEGVLKSWPRSLEAVIERADVLLPQASDWIRGDPAPLASVDSVSLLAPLRRPGKIICIGRNYNGTVDRAPQMPAIFCKLGSSITGPDAPIWWDDSQAHDVDYEAELAVVIGRTASNVPERDALSYVFGYSCVNDVIARNLEKGDQWLRAKSFDSFCPFGPWLVTADEIPDPQNLDVSCVVSGELRQSSSTAEMIFPVAYLISFLSRSFPLYPGDIIATGTPMGTGASSNPPRFLRAGDDVTVAVGGIGELHNPVHGSRGIKPTA